ncbi:MAG: hypothetical protein ABIE22_04675 [archaeon]
MNQTDKKCVDGIFDYLAANSSFPKQMIERSRKFCYEISGCLSDDSNSYRTQVLNYLAVSLICDKKQILPALRNSIERSHPGMQKELRNMEAYLVNELGMEDLLEVMPKRFEGELPSASEMKKTEDLSEAVFSERFYRYLESKGEAVNVEDDLRFKRELKSVKKRRRKC